MVIAIIENRVCRESHDKGWTCPTCKRECESSAELIDHIGKKALVNISSPYAYSVISNLLAFLIHVRK